MTNSGYVLLADDNATDAELTTRALDLGGISRNVVWVQDGEAALNYLLRKGIYAQRPAGNPRLMLLDLHMPKVDGLDVLARIKSDPLLRSIPIVIMSSSDEEADMARSYEKHANSYIVKPVDFKLFTEQVSMLGQYWMRVNKALG
ncbi:MAG TPA: response regulator [Povalibacter sp.]|nr:response regulator [Povalibacter sp.]